MKESRKSIYKLFSSLSYLPIFLIVILFLNLFLEFSILTYLIICSQLLILFLSIIISIVIKCDDKKERVKLGNGILYVALLLIYVAALPNIAFRNYRKSPLSACKSSLKSIANALDMYQSDHGHFPDPSQQYPAQKNGILFQTGYIKNEIACPLHNTDYYCVFSTDSDSFTIYCTVPDFHLYKPDKTLRLLKYEFGKGIVTDPEEK